MKSSPRWMNAGAFALFALFLGLIAASPANAAVITQQISNGKGQDWSTNNTWMTGAHVPSVENDYIVPAGLLLRTPGGNNASYVFGGGSLTIETGGTLATKMNTSGAIVTINQLILNGGSLGNAGPDGATNVLHIVAGQILITGTGSTIAGGGDGFVRNLQINSLLSGTSPLTIGYASSATTNSVIFTNAANSYTGAMTVARGILEFTYDFSTDQLLQHLIVESGGKVNLNHNITVQALSVDNVLLTPGVYGYDDFATLGLGSFFVSGTGAITVAPVPEPRLGLLVLLGAGLLWRNRRSRRAARA